MILRNSPTRIAITQPDHAALAGRIMRAWRGKDLTESPRRDDILLAVSEHDNGWREVDDTLLVDPATGAVLDFMTVPAHIRRGVWTRAIARLSATPYAAALVAQHAAHVYGRYRSDPTWGAFFAEMEASRDQYLRAVGVSSDQLFRDYLFVRIGDLASLIFCTQVAMQAPEFGYIVRLEADRLIISPDPFGGVTIPISIDGHELAGYTYARPVRLTGVVTGP